MGKGPASAGPLRSPEPQALAPEGPAHATEKTSASEIESQRTGGRWDQAGVFPADGLRAAEKINAERKLGRATLRGRLWEMKKQPPPAPVSLSATLHKHWKRLLGFIGISGALDLVKEYLRGKVMDWAISHLGGFGHWLFADTFAFLSIATSIAVLAIVGTAVLGGKPNITPTSQTPRLSGNALGWKIPLTSCGVVLAALIFIGAYKYVLSQPSSGKPETTPAPGRRQAKQQVERSPCWPGQEI